MSTVKEDGLEIIKQSIQAVLPKEAVEKALAGKEFSGKVEMCIRDRLWD